MKKVRIFAAMAALMTLGLAACGGEANTESASAAPTSSKAASSAAKSSSKKPSSSKPVSSSKPAGPDYTQVIAHTWTEGAPMANADGKNYIQLTDATANKVGVKIAITDWVAAADAIEGTTLGSDGKIAPVNEKTAIIGWKVKAPKAGDYQMVMTAKCSSNGTGYTLNQRSVTCRLNGEAVDIDDSRDPLTTEMAEFVLAPTIHLTGNEDTIEISACDYRPVFDTASFVVFAEH